MRPFELSRRQLLGRVGALTAAAGTAGTGAGRRTADPGDDPPEVGPVQAVPDVADGFAATPLVPLDFPTQLTFGPGNGDGPDLYAPTIGGGLVAERAGGRVLRIPLRWTPNGPVAGDARVVAEGFDLPLGIAALGGPLDAPATDTGPPAAVGDGDTPTLVVTDTSESVLDFAPTVGRVLLLRDGESRPIVDGLPTARAGGINQLAIGPDGRLYIALSSASNVGEGNLDVFPYSGSVIAVDLPTVIEDPAVLERTDANGDPIPPHEVSTHPVNADFNRKVDVVAWGFRDNYGLAFGPDGVPHVSTAGGQNPDNQDLFYRLDDRGRDAIYGYPWVFSRGTPGATGDDIRLARNPVFDEADGKDEPFFETDQEFDDFDYRDPSNFHRADALLGFHLGATGIGFARGGRSFSFPEPYRGDAFVGESLVLSAESAVEKQLERATTRGTSHKVSRIVTDDDGTPTDVRAFVTGLTAPTDVRFGPDGAMYIADAEMVYRVVPTAATDAGP